MDSFELEVVKNAIDQAFYLHTNPDVQASGSDPATHYCEVGWREGRDPAPWFSTAHYLRDYADIGDELNPLAHYLTVGIREGRRATPSTFEFSGQVGTASPQTNLAKQPRPALQEVSEDQDLVEQADAIRSEFDALYYLAQLSEAGLTSTAPDPALHYVKTGHDMGLNPTDWFSTREYLRENADVAVARVNAFYHYVVAGRAEGRSIIARQVNSVDDQAVDERLVYETNLIKHEFDAEYYLEQSGLPDDTDPVFHFIKDGWKKGSDPSSWFSVAGYHVLHPDVEAAGINPFVHYLEAGRAEHRAIMSGREFILRQALAAGTSDDFSHLANCLGILEEEFDAEYYVGTYIDVRDAGVDPFVHFMQTGWREGRNPNAFFSVSDYLESNTDVQVAGVNPFAHYLAVGKSEGRSIKPELGFRFDIIRTLRTPEQCAADARLYPVATEESSSENLRSALAYLDSQAGSSYYISISHDNFTAHFGGIQLCLAREADAVREKGYQHFHIFPAQPLALVELNDDDPLLGLILNNDLLGYYKATTISHFFGDVNASQSVFAIHSLLGHNSSATIRILKAIRADRGFFWLHDYASVCAGFTLLRNDVEFCHAPPSTSAACQICIYGPHRLPQVRAHEELLSAFDISVVSPSQASADVWRRAVGDGREVLIHNHCEFTDAIPQRRRSKRQVLKPLRVAFLGLPAPHKGWLEFRELVLKFGRSPRYEFFHLGKQKTFGLPISFIDTEVNSENLGAMVENIRNAEIDLALIWSIWPETFCFTAYEAIAGGAAIAVRKGSGNLPFVVSDPSLLAVFDDERSLEVAFEDGSMAQYARWRREAAGFGLRYSSMTGDFLEPAK